MMIFRQMIRSFSLWLEGVTSEWVLSQSCWKLIDDEKFGEARQIISQAERVWGEDDPVITRAHSTIRFLEEPVEED